MIDTVRAFAVRWLLEPAKKQPAEQGLRIVITPISNPDFVGGSYGDLHYDGAIYEYRKYLVAKIYNNGEYLGWYSSASYDAKYDIYREYGDYGDIDHVISETIYSGTGTYKIYSVETETMVITGISKKSARAYKLSISATRRLEYYDENDIKIDESYSGEYSTSTGFYFQIHEKTYGDYLDESYPVNVFGDGLTLEIFSEQVYKNLSSAVVEYNNG